MRGRRWLALVAVALLLPACASSTKTKKAKTAPANPLAPKAFFWEARAANGAQLFLLGSVHIGDGRQLVLDTRIEQDWTQAQELVVELDSTSLSPIDAVDATNRFGLLPRGTTLKNVVSPETYKQVQKYMKSRNYEMERVDRMRPWLVAQVVTQLEYAAAGLDAENGVDVAMMRRAAGHKGIVPLESLDEQAALFAGLPPPMQETMLVEILHEAQALLAVTRATLGAWEQGDEPTLSDLLFGNSSKDPAIAEFYERVFYSRNRSMTDRLVALSADGHPRFVVVGTGHLIGAQGIPELLAQRGFQVERVGSAHVVPGAEAQLPATAVPAPAATQAPTAPRQVPAPATVPAPVPVAAPTAPTPAATPAAPAAQPAQTAPILTTPAAPPPAVQPALAPPAPAQPALAPPAPAPPTPASATPTTATPTASAPARDTVHEQWLLQDAAPEGTAAPPPMAAPAVEPAPAPPPPAAEPPPAKKKKSRMLSRPKP